MIFVYSKGVRVFILERSNKSGQTSYKIRRKKVKLNVSIKKYVDLVKEQDNQSEFVENAIVEHLKEQKL